MTDVFSSSRVSAPHVLSFTLNLNRKQDLSDLVRLVSPSRLVAHLIRWLVSAASGESARNPKVASGKQPSLRESFFLIPLSGRLGYALQHEGLDAKLLFRFNPPC